MLIPTDVIFSRPDVWAAEKTLEKQELMSELHEKNFYRDYIVLGILPLQISMVIFFNGIVL